MRAGGSEGLIGSSPNWRILIQNNVDRNARQYRREFGLLAERSEERSVFHLGQDLRCDPTSHIDAPKGKGAQGKISSFGAIGFRPKIQCRDTHRTGVGACFLGNLTGGIGGGAVERRMTNVGTQEFVDSANTSPRKNVLATDMREMSFQVNEKLDLAICSWGKACQATLRRKHAIPLAIPAKKRLAQTSANGH